MPFSSSRRRSRGIISKDSSGIWKVENEGIDSIRERYKIKDHRLNGRRRRGRLVSDESSDESFSEEMEEERNCRRTIKKARLKVYDEIIGVHVPRRARSAISGLKRIMQDSVTAAQPSAGSKENIEEMVPISESEVEVAKFLFGLTRLRSQHSDAAADTFLTTSVPDISAVSKDVKRKKSRHLQSVDTDKRSKSDGTSNQVDATGFVPASFTNGHQLESCSLFKETATSSPKLDKICSPNDNVQSKMEEQLLAPQSQVPVSVVIEEKPSPTSPINCELFMSPDHHEKPNSTPSKKEDESSNASCKTGNKQTEQVTVKESNHWEHDLVLPLLSQSEKLDPHKSASPVSSDGNCVKKVKYEIDLMALPDEGEVDASDECHPKMSDINQGSSHAESISKNIIVKLSDMKGMAKDGMEKPLNVGGKNESCQVGNIPDNTGAKQHSEKMMKDATFPSTITGLSSTLTTKITAPIPMSAPCWPGGIQPFGLPNAGPAPNTGPVPNTGSASFLVAPSLHGTVPMEGNTLTPHAPLVMLPPRRSGHCATHCFIARLIHYQQQLAKLNSFCHPSGLTAKSYNLPILPQPGALFLGSPGTRKPNAAINGSLQSGSMVPLNGFHPGCDTETGKHSSLQQPHQGVILLPSSQMQSKTAVQRTDCLPENGSLLPTSSASSASILASTGCMKLAPVSDLQKRYLTMFKGNNPFPNHPAYRSYMAHQQHFSPQLGSQPLQLTPSHSSTGRSIQVRQFLQTSKTASEAFISKPEQARHGEVPPFQRTLQNYSLAAGEHGQLPSPLVNHARTPLTAYSSNNSNERLSELNRRRRRMAAQTNSPISTSSLTVSRASSLASVDRNNPQGRVSSSQMMSKPEASVGNSSSGEVTLVPSLTTAKRQQMFCSNSVPGVQHNMLSFPGSLDMRKSTVGSLNGLTAAAAVSFVQGTSSLPVKPAEQKPAEA